MFNSLLTALTIGIVSFISTNIDDLVILVLLFSYAKIHFLRPAVIVLGQFLGMFLIIGASLVGSCFGITFIPAVYLKFLGLGPIFLGLSKLYRRKDLSFDSKSTHTPALAFKHYPTLSVALITLASGTDNLSVYIPLFTESQGEFFGIILITFFLMTGLWCILAAHLTTYPKLNHFLSRRPIIFPLILLIIGTYLIFF